MAFTMRKLGLELKTHSPGIIIGAVAGLIAAAYAVHQGVADLNQLAEAGKGALDSILGRNAAPIELAKTKLYIVFAFIGATIGLIADKIVTRK